MSYLEKYKILSTHFEHWQPPATKLRILKFLEKSQNVISRKLQEFEQSNLAAKHATPGNTLEEPHHKDETSNFVNFLNPVSLNNLNLIHLKNYNSYTLHPQ